MVLKRQNSLRLSISVYACVVLVAWVSSCTFSIEIVAEDNVLPQPQSDSNFVIAGQCVKHSDFRSSIPDVEIRLFSVIGLLQNSTEIAKTVSDDEGKFRFSNLEPPRENRLNGLRYYFIAKPKKGAVNISTLWNPDEAQTMRLSISERSLSLKGNVADERGEPIEGARLELYTGAAGIEATPSTTSNKHGLFVLQGLPVYTDRKGKPYGIPVVISHPDYPTTTIQTDEVTGYVSFTVEAGCRVTGVVQDSATGAPLRDKIVSAVPVESGSAKEAHAVTDAEGRYRLNLLQGNYKVILEDGELVAKAVEEVACPNGGQVELEPLKASAGGWIVGQVINTATGKPMVLTPEGKRIALGFFGPSRPQPQGRLVHLHRLAEVDGEGRFRIRAEAGENFPFFCNLSGNRMPFSTTKQPPVVVEKGNETSCVMEFTPPLTPEQKMEIAYRVFNALPEETDKRVEAIIEEFRKLNHTVDECETWCLLMRELVAIGKPAVLPLCREFEATNEQRMMRRLAFALRAIGDPRAVPILIRVLPKTLQPPMSDYGLIVADPELAAFMREHADGKDRGQYFSFGRPVRETHYALTELTKRKVDVRELSSMHKSKDLRSLARQEQFYHETATEWANWWEANWQKFDVDDSFSKVNLPPYVPRDLSNYPTGLRLTENAVVDGGLRGMVVTPIGDADQGADFFLDLDTRGRPRWPNSLPHGDNSPDVVAAARKWAAEQGVDLICVPTRNEDGDVVYTLTGIGLQLWEIDPFEAKNIAKRVENGELPEGRQVEGALLHYDPETRQYVSQRESSFLYVTREQGLGVITVTDFVTEARDLTGTFGAPPRGVGFHRGVRFNYQTIAR